ncbi:chemotaxis protein CheC [Pelomonas sp. SE-A7]|uniref:chemotaxis protein CheC n=1 Tax=Pelomonas sp. SE-A7 TaxID=3054953 RepID=UPI00259D1AA1|nr:chemotaxis protein CheC [Pelomonas sp. SE-A7]MDM4765081.1 chemotaxis protein CheC [Pelomonas sp. SE-A7]
MIGAQLDELEADALAEVFNVSVADAANLLGGLMNEPVGLSVPKVELMPMDQAMLEFARLTDDRVCLVSQHCQGLFTTEALLLFTEAGSLEMVRSLMSPHLPIDSFDDLGQETMAEIGNILLNTCTGAISNLFGAELATDVPLVKVGSLQDVFAELLLNSETLKVLFISIDLQLTQRQIHGQVAYLLDVPSLDVLRHSITRVLASASP